MSTVTMSGHSDDIPGPAVAQVWRTYTGAEYASVHEIPCWVISNGLLIDADGETTFHEDNPDIAAEIERRGQDVYRDHGYGDGHDGVHVAGCDHSEPETLPAPMIALLRDLRAAGWCHAKETVDTGRDSDGAPWDDGREVHRWRRDGAAISVEEYFVMYDPHDDEGDQFGDIAVGEDWIKRYGADGLRKLAESLGILPPNVPEGLTKLTVYLTEKALTALTVGAAACGDTKADTVNRALIDYASTAGAKAVLSLAIGLPKAKAKS